MLRLNLPRIFWREEKYTAGAPSRIYNNQGSRQLLYDEAAGGLCPVLTRDLLDAFDDEHSVCHSTQRYVAHLYQLCCTDGSACISNKELFH